jgi:DNA-binding NarL/FixJ family response regulator
LVVEDDAPTLRAMVREVRGRFRPVPCRTLADAHKEMARLGTAPAGVIVDVRLPDGSGLDLLSEIKKRYPGIGALVLTGKATPEIINRSHLLDAGFAVKPDAFANLRAFLKRLAKPPEPEPEPEPEPQPLADAVKAFIEEYALTKREADLVVLLAQGEPRAELADSLHVGEGTVKTHIKHILKKTGDRDVGELLARILRGANGDE